jgi:cobalt-zinc-cadmium efflux system membrane fusion protein
MLAPWIVCAVSALLLAGCSGERTETRHEEHGGHDAKGHHDENGEHEEHGDHDHRRGPHGGRIFSAENDALELEIAIDENEGQPQFVAWLSDGSGVPLSNEGATLSVKLHRFAGRTQVIPLSAMRDHWRSELVVGEPHSFRAIVNLRHGDREHSWSWEQIEFRVDLSPEEVASGGIETSVPGPKSLNVFVETPGEVRLNGERVVLVRPRFPGIVTDLRVRLGDTIAAGDTLAVVQSSESLSEYAIKASIGGTIVSQNVATGAAVERETVLYSSADLSSVWVDFAIYPQHVGRVRRGQPAVVTSSSGMELRAEGQVSYVGPLLEQDTRVSYGRVVLPNPEGLWQPGLYVTVRVTVEDAEVAVAVPESAVIRSSFGPAVFLTDGSSFELQPITAGRSDGEFVEVASDLPPGVPIVVRNAFVLKAELGKSEASHDH